MSGVLYVRESVVVSGLCAGVLGKTRCSCVEEYRRQECYERGYVKERCGAECD